MDRVQACQVEASLRKIMHRELLAGFNTWREEAHESATGRAAVTSWSHRLLSGGLLAFRQGPGQPGTCCKL